MNPESKSSFEKSTSRGGITNWESPQNTIDSELITQDIQDLNNEGIVVIPEELDASYDPQEFPIINVSERQRNSWYKKIGVRALPFAAAFPFLLAACQPSNSGETDEIHPTASATSTATSTSTPILESTPTPSPTSTPSATPEVTTTVVPEGPKGLEKLSPELQEVIKKLPYEVGMVEQHGDIIFVVSKEMMTRTDKPALTKIEFDPNIQDSEQRLQDLASYTKYLLSLPEDATNPALNFTYEDKKAEVEAFKKRLAGGEYIKGLTYGHLESVYPAQNDRTHITKLTPDLRKPIFISWVPDKRISTYATEDISYGAREINNYYIQEIFDDTAGHPGKEQYKFQLAYVVAAGLGYIGDRQALKLGSSNPANISSHQILTNDIYLTFLETSALESGIVRNPKPIFYSVLK